MPPTQYVGLYCRFSTFRDGGSENVEDQEVWGRAHAAETWPGVPVEIFVDDGITAADDNAYRPGFERLRRWLAEGKLVHLWASEQTRLCRTNRWFSFADELEAARVYELHTRRGGVVTIGEIASDMQAVVDKHEVKRLKKRVRDKHDRLAAQGRPSGGSRFGYRRDVDPTTGQKTLTIDPEQAEHIRWAAAQILDGKTKTRVAKDLAAKGVVGARGAEIGPQNVESMLTNPSVAGLRIHHGELIRDPTTGEVLRATWDPILDLDTWHAVKAKLAITATKGLKPERRKYQLSGVVACSECKDRYERPRRMVGNTLERVGRATATRYLCKGCGCSINAGPLEAHVAERLLARLDHLAERLIEDDYAERRETLSLELGAIGNRRAMGGRMLARGDLSEADYPDFKAELDDRETELQRQLAELPAVVGKDKVDPDAVRKAWRVGTVEERREIVGMWVERISVTRAQAGKSRLAVDLGRVTIEGAGWDD